MKKLIWFVKCLFGFGSVKEGSVCWFSKKYFDVHDYPITKGGDGIPTSFHTYQCPNCKKEFGI